MDNRRKIPEKFDEITLRGLFTLLWKNSFFIAAVMILFAMGGVFFVMNHRVEPEFAQFLGAGSGEVVSGHCEAETLTLQENYGMFPFACAMLGFFVSSFRVLLKEL